MTTTAPLFQQVRERKHDSIGRHKANEKRVANTLDSYIREYVSRVLEASNGWSKWFYCAPQLGLENPKMSIANWIQDRYNVTAAADSYRRRFTAVCKEMGVEVENMNSKGLYRIRK